MVCALWMFIPVKLTQKVILALRALSLLSAALEFRNRVASRPFAFCPLALRLLSHPMGILCRVGWRKARKGGHELLLQLPMEPYGYPQTNAGKHSLLSSTQTQSNLKELHWSLGRITNYVGVMNYLGGKMLTSPHALAPIFEDLSARGLMFVDDGSIRSSIAKNLAKPAKLPFARAHVTIDATRTRSHIQKQLQNLEIQAKRTGYSYWCRNSISRYHCPNR